jgi:hypothetical protein
VLLRDLADVRSDPRHSRRKGRQKRLQQPVWQFGGTWYLFERTCP